jgi:hypothetical protein
LDAESTITRPNKVSRPKTASTRCSEVSGRANQAVSRSRAAATWAAVHVPGLEELLLTGPPGWNSFRWVSAVTVGSDCGGEGPTTLRVVGEHVH